MDPSYRRRSPHENQLWPIKPTEVYDTYWLFAYERQEVFFRRLSGVLPPWTTDPIVLQHKFTNAYRASDRVSQYLIRNVIYQGDQSVEEVFFRAILFKIFNRIETWELLEQNLGVLSYAEYSFDEYDRILTEASRQGKSIFSAAYIMASGESSFGSPRKHHNFLKLLELLMRDNVPVRLQETRLMRHAFELLRSYPLLGDFLAYQYIIDLNYSEITNFSEMEFVMPGPGARDGIHKCFQSLGGLSEADVIRLVTERQDEEFSRLGVEFHSLWGRPLQLIDCQNLFCEVGKYARLAHPNVLGLSGRTRIKQLFHPKEEPIICWYPPKWGLNELIKREVNSGLRSASEVQHDPSF
jgi:hypothetical protein